MPGQRLLNLGSGWIWPPHTAPNPDTASLMPCLPTLLLCSNPGSWPCGRRARHLALRRFAAWLVDEGELPTDPLLGIRPPKLDTKIVEPLSTDELTRLIRVCQGRDFIDRRDEAIIRLMTETGCRAGEVVALGLADLDLPNGTATVRRGKGGPGHSGRVTGWF